jgi:glycogen debranching enzyme
MHRLVMNPEPGERLVRFVGDQISFSLTLADGAPLPAGWQARLRTNLGRGEVLRQEVIHAHTGRLPLANASWRDVPMQLHEGVGSISFSLTEVGFFKAKAYAVDAEGRQHWPQGPDFGLSVHPDAYRSANTIYCAFPRMFGETKAAIWTKDEKFDHLLRSLDQDGFTVIPASGKLRDVIAELPHIINTLGCRILHLLPVNPTPTTYARFGRFGSPYAVQDLLAIDPALVEFDKRTTGIDQFRELTYATHARGAKVFLDIVINHTGWGSTLQENHPEWYVRDKDGNFACPGAWGVVWEDLAELNHENPELWEYLSEVFIEWCRRGVDGFRCDAGYKIPGPAWRYIIARLQEEFPDTIFLLEGLGGPWEATENLLTEGGMQWAYSELFQNEGSDRIANYLDYALRQSRRVGLYVNYSETHDNHRLAERGRAWSLLRNRLCALTSLSGGFGFTCGVEWLAQEKISVHDSRGLAWGSQQNIVRELAHLNRLLAEHPCFLDDAEVRRLSPPESHVLALSRVSADGQDKLLVLVNNDLKEPRPLLLDESVYSDLGSPTVDLLGQTSPNSKATSEGQVEFRLRPGECLCLSDAAEPRGLRGEAYREARAQSAWAITMISRRFRVRDISPFNWRLMAEFVQRGAKQFLSAVSRLDPALVKEDVLAALRASTETGFQPVVSWDLLSRRRVTVVPQGHWLLLEDTAPFRATLKTTEPGKQRHVQSVRIGQRHYASFASWQGLSDAELRVERYAADHPFIEAAIRFVGPPGSQAQIKRDPAAMVLLTNGRGGMARLRMALGSVRSKYDCLLGANLHPSVPVDRQILAKRARVWVSADDFITALDLENLIDFRPGPPARWRFVASAGDGRAVEIVLTVDMLDGRNTTVLRFHRAQDPPPFGRELPTESKVFLTVRVDIEDRGFHSETHRNGGADHHFNAHTQPLKGRTGFEFKPSFDRHLRVFADAGVYHPEVEWSEAIAHPIEGTRGQVDHGDAYSPGWFELPLAKGATITLVATADLSDPLPAELTQFVEARRAANEQAVAQADIGDDDRFGRRLARAVRAFVVRRGEGKTVVAGYPWFLDWGRDTLICARGLLAAGMTNEVQQMLETFGRFEDRGTLPNTIFGEDASNRDTSDAPLWFGVVCEELAAKAAEPSPLSRPFAGSSHMDRTPSSSEDALARAGGAPRLPYSVVVDQRGRTIADILRWIAAGYRDGTPNGIRMDPASALIWSPGHFTWMDTSFPAATPREGYPIEIQVLWIRLLRQLSRLGEKSIGETWAKLAERAEESFQKLFWLGDQGWFADVLLAQPGQTATGATPDTALRSNCLFAISLGLATGERARRCVDAALRYLVVPGAVRSLAPLPVSPPLPVRSSDGQLLNDPANPYCGRYEGDEDTRRKPAYHNGTAWTWSLPVFCEALVRAWDFDPTAVAAAKSYLGSMQALLDEGCIGHLPEVVDGDAPHAQRGCDAQAWSATEALRIWKMLNQR